MRRRDRRLVLCDCSVCLRDHPNRPTYLSPRTAYNHRIADQRRLEQLKLHSRQVTTSVSPEESRSQAEVGDDGYTGDVEMPEAPLEEEQVPAMGSKDAFDPESSEGNCEDTASEGSDNDSDDLEYLMNEAYISQDNSAPPEHGIEEALSQQPFGFFVVFLALFQLNFLTERATEILIQFLQVVILLCGLQFELPYKASTVYNWSNMDFSTAGVTCFVVCQKCHSVYNEDCVERRCTFVLFPDHEWASMQNARCKNLLFQLISGNQRKPRSVYCYNSLVESLKILFSRPDFEGLISHWRRRSVYERELLDVYDGRMWSELKDVTGAPFVEMQRSLMLTLNIDWFQPYSNSPHSCGAIYLTVNNLPRSVRNKMENVILVGMIPGPKEPSKEQINQYLKPLVDDLVEFHEGVWVPTAKKRNGALVRAALLMIACDIPAARKVSGFTSHNSFFACHKCNRQFPSLPGSNSRDFSGFEDSQWPRRSCQSNREAANRWKCARSATERKQIEQETGTRWSELHRLSYLDLVRCTTIDPMHNLFLGTAKRMINVWLDCDNPNLPGRKLLTDAHVKEMEKQAASILLPPGYDQFHRKIGSKFAYMKADEWKTWCLVLSPLLLKTRLPDSHALNWIKFVDATRLLCRPSISIDELEDAHDLLREFLKGCERLYGKKEIMPNMHLHLHLLESIMDFGPVYSFWLFNFERYNGVIKGSTINNRDESITSTYMHQFLKAAYSQDYIRSLPQSISENSMMMKVLSRMISKSKSIVRTSTSSFDFSQYVAYAETTAPVFGYEALPPFTPPPKLGRPLHMGASHYKCLVDYYQAMYPLESFTSFRDPRPINFIGDIIQKFFQIEILGEIYNSKEYHRTARGQHIQALIRINDASHDPVLCPGQVLYFFKHTLIFQDGQEKEHTFAFVKWFRQREPAFAYFPRYRLRVWRKESYPHGKLSILPVQRIYSHVVVSSYVDNTNIVLPFPRKCFQ